MTIPKASTKNPSNQPKLSCINCGDNIGNNSRGVHAFQSFINNAPAKIFVEAAIKEIYRIHDQPDFKFQDECVLCVHCCLLFSQMFGLFRLFEARQKPEGLLASCSRNPAWEGNGNYIEIQVNENEAVGDEGLGRVTFHQVDDPVEDDSFHGYQSSEEMDDETADQTSFAADSPHASSPPTPPDDYEEDEDNSKSEAEDAEGSKTSKAYARALKNDDQRELIFSKICPDGKQLIFQCADCSENFQQAAQLRTHRVSAHDSREAYKCAVCNNVLSSETIFRRHLFEHVKVAKKRSGIKCSLCKRKFPSRLTLAKHKTLIHPSALTKKLRKTRKPKQIGRTDCPMCGEMFDSVLMLRKHRLAVHALAVQSTASHEEPEVGSGLELGADVEIGNENLVSDEEADVQESVDPDFIPDSDHSSCESAFEDEDLEVEDQEDEDQGEEDQKEGRKEKTVRKHKTKKRLLPIAEGQLICNDCPNQYMNLEGYYRHRKFEHPDSPPYQCYICQVICQTGNVLLRHVVEQHNINGSQSEPPQSEVTFKCTDCNLTYNSVGTFGKHRKEQHGDVERPFKCHLCPVGAFKNPQSLSDHMLFKHSGAPLPKCKECGKTFCNHHMFRNHMRDKHQIAVMSGVRCAIPESCNKIIFVCVKCNHEEFPTEDAFFEHNKNVHHQDLLKCPKCPKSYTSEATFTRHLESHEKNPYACDICEATFPHAWDLKRHSTYEHTEQPPLGTDEDIPSTEDNKEADNIEINQDPTTQLFICPQCSLQFTIRAGCIGHLRDVHPELMTFECEICSQKFMSMDTLNKHKKGIHQTVKCEYCDFVSNFQGVKRHHRKAHTSIRKKTQRQLLQEKKRRLKEEIAAKKLDILGSYKCADCDESFNRLKLLVTHRTEAHPDQEKLKCPHCHMAFKDLEKHILVHNESTDWPCGECSTRFRKKAERNRHLEQVHNIHKDKHDQLPLPPGMTLKHLSGEVSTVEKPQPTMAKEKKVCKCPECDEEFIFPSNMGNHRVIVHGISPSQRFKCYQCSTISASLVAFMAHIERHGEKSHLCPECGKCFTTRDYLKQHIGLMHDEVAGARYRAKYKRSRDKKKGSQATGSSSYSKKKKKQVEESNSTTEVTSNDESDMEL